MATITREQPLIKGVMLMCPWCGIWEHLEAYTLLMTPPNFHSQTVPIYKHSGSRGCKKLFAIGESQWQ